MIDLLQIPGFLNESETAAVLQALRAAGDEAATVSGSPQGHAVISLVRSARRIQPPAAVQEGVAGRLREARERLAAHFGAQIARCDPPQFLRYGEGDYFVAHQDGNTPLLHDDTRFRRVSAVVFLNDRSPEPAAGCYGGGELVFHAPPGSPAGRVPVAPAPGTLVAFRSETTHEVLPVTHGERYTIAAWFR